MKSIAKEQVEIKKVEDGTIVSPLGYKADGIHAGLKKEEKKDLGIILSEYPANAAAVYTTNHFQAAPIKVTQESIAAEHKLQAVVCNSGNANACTGDEGLANAYIMRKAAAEKFQLKEDYVAVASTGVIGEQLPIDVVVKGISKLAPAEGMTAGGAFNQSILTTDLVEKQACYQTIIDGKTVTIAASAKGSGMIHPNMATMLGFLTTDANIEQESLQAVLRKVVNETFNCITVDGDSSTNDTVLIMANGAAGNSALSEEHAEWDKFYTALKQTCEEMAKAIAFDGEGATKLIEVQVEGAAANEEASLIAKNIVGSSLVKTMVYGADANWGRVVCAVGYSEAQVDPNAIDVYLGDVQLLKAGQPVAYSEEAAKNVLLEDEVLIKVNLNLGDGFAKAWGCDLTYDYVKINASYRT